MLVSKLTLGRQEGGQAPTRAEMGGRLFPSLPPPEGSLSSAPSPGGGHFGSEGCDGGGFGGQEGGVVGTSLLRERPGGRMSAEGTDLGVSFPPKPPSLGHCLRQGGQRPAWGSGLGVFLLVFFFNLRSCARTLALCRVFVCVCKTRAEDTPKLLQRHCGATAPMDQKT